MDTADIHAAFAKAGLARLVKDIDTLAKPSMRLLATPVDETSIVLGASKIGGLPDLPPGIHWPELNGVPQSFIAQIRLEEVHPYDSERLLPERGMLWFFYDALQETYGADPQDCGGWQVILQDISSAYLQRATIPATLPAQSRFKAASVRFVPEITLSQVPKLDLPAYDWSDEELEKYEDLIAELVPPDERAFRHRLLGNADLIQDDLRLQCHLVSHGVTDEDDPRAQKLAAGAMDWRLLLQVDTDERLGMRWSSTGMLYYCITATNLRARRFETAWLVMQAD
ncbi:MAG: DUF1963 domain-containing protein [Ktedonobacteraceae bacterium]|nr:DUF1963 domain-containing protein [Ktedonobacteraceae bacterium]